MRKYQNGIMDPVPQHGCHLFFSLAPGADPRAALASLRELCDGRSVVAGLGLSLVQALGSKIDGLTTFPQYAGNGFDVPSTPFALWCWLRGTDRGELLHLGRRLEQALSPHLQLIHTVDVFKYKSGLDLSGYEDGTENPQDAAAVEAAIVSGLGVGMDGSSFVAVQQWVHDLDHFEGLSSTQQDNIIGRHKIGNEEIDDAPASAHVKRTAQESFSPEAFILRRSMPWSAQRQSGLVFLAFGNSFKAYDALLRRMVGEEDGISDALFSFTRPVSGSYFWCPPMTQGHLDLSRLGLQV